MMHAADLQAHFTGQLLRPEHSIQGTISLSTILCMHEGRHASI